MSKEPSSRGKSALGGSRGKSKKSGGSKPHSIHVRRAKSGGFVATHHHKPDFEGAMQESDEHVLPDIQSLQAHMQDQMGDQPAAPVAPPLQAGPPQGVPAGM